MQNSVLQQRLHPDWVTACVLEMCEPVPTLLLGALPALVRQQSCVQPPLLPFHIGSSAERFRHADGIRITASLERRTTHPQRLQEHVPHTLRHVHRRQPGIDEELVEGGEELPCSRCNISHSLQALTKKCDSDSGPMHIVRHTASEAPLDVSVSGSVEGCKLVPCIFLAIECISPGQLGIGIVRRPRQQLQKGGRSQDHGGISPHEGDTERIHVRVRLLVHRQVLVRARNRSHRPCRRYGRGRCGRARARIRSSREQRNVRNRRSGDDGLRFRGPMKVRARSRSQRLRWTHFGGFIYVRIRSSW